MNGNSESNNTLQMVPPVKEFRAKSSQWVGEFQDASGASVGLLYKTADSEWRVFRLREFGRGEVEAQSRPLAKEELERCGSVAVGGGSSVRFYRLKTLAGE